PRILRASMYSRMAHITPSASQHDHIGTVSPRGTRKKIAPLVVRSEPSNNSTQMDPIRYPMLNRCPQYVRCTALMVAPNPAATKNTPNMSAPAAGFHFTHADNASASSDSTSTQIHPPKKIPDA